MIAARGASIGEQFAPCTKNSARILARPRESSSFRHEQKAKRRQTRGRGRFDTRRKESYIYRPHRWRKIVFEDGRGCCCAFPAPSRCFALYVEAESAAASAKLTREASQWVLQN